MSQEQSTHGSGAARPRGSSVARAAVPTAELVGPLDDQPTVISSKSDPLGLRQAGRLNPAEIGQLLVGEQLGQFELVSFVGGGGMGAVFRARDLTLNREVAVKVLSRTQASDEETRRRFINEAQSAARLDHQNIARVYFVGEERGVHFIVFEYVEGVNIRDLVERDGPLPLVEAVSYTLQVAEALAHISRRDVIHRDIKPSNVLITPEGRAKLVDMGLARLHQVESGAAELTASGVTLGTFDYISPEQARDPRSADVRSDLYSLGCSFYFMLTGQPPFPEGTVLQKLLQHQETDPPDPRTLRADLPESLARIVGRLLAKRPEDRYQQPGALIAELLLAADALGLPVSAAPSAVWSVPHPAPSAAGLARHLAWLVPLLAVLLTVVVLDFFWSRDRRDLALPSLPPLKPARAAVVPRPPSQRETKPIEQPSADAADDDPSLMFDEEMFDEPLDPSTDAAPEANPSPGDAVPAEGRWTLEQLRGQAYAVARTLAELSPLGWKPADEEPPTIADAAADADRAGLHVVSEADEGTDSHTMLEAALKAAKSGDVVELRYNGRRLERPLSLANTRLTIRAGRGYRPTIGFRPTAADPAGAPRSMISLVGGQLTLVDVHLELSVPRDVPADNWSLFEVRKSELVRLERCTLTVRNASFGQASLQPDVAFFTVRSPPGSDGMMIMPLVRPSVEEEPQAVALELHDSLARGEASLVRLADPLALRLAWDNGLLASSERLLVAQGGLGTPRGTAHVQLDLRHLTAVVRGGLCGVLSSVDAPVQPTLELRCGDSILLGGGGPLVEQRGVDRPDVLRGRFHWNGNRVFYEGFDTFWKTSDPSSAAGEPLRWDYEAWRTHWGSQFDVQSKQNAVLWSGLPDPTRALHTHLPADYALAAAESNPARGAAGDGGNVGARLNRLPTPPAEADDRSPEATTPKK